MMRAAAIERRPAVTHDYQQINIRVRIGIAIRVRAEEDYFSRMEPGDNIVDKGFDLIADE